MRSLQDLGDQDRSLRSVEFGHLVKSFAAARGSWAGAALIAEQTRSTPRVVEVAKAAIGAAGPGTGQWGSELVGYRLLASGFLDSLRSRSAFFAMLPGLARVPLQTRLGILTTNATAWIVGAGKPIPLSKLAFAAGPSLDPIRAAALIVVTDELLRSTAPGAEASFNRELRGAVADVVDNTFLG